MRLERFKSECGLAMMLVLAFMAFAVPIVTVSLSLSSTLNIDSQKKTKDLKSEYSVLAGS